MRTRCRTPCRSFQQGLVFRGSILVCFFKEWRTKLAVLPHSLCNNSLFQSTWQPCLSRSFLSDHYQLLLQLWQAHGPAHGLRDSVPISAPDLWVLVTRVRSGEVGKRRQMHLFTLNLRKGERRREILSYLVWRVQHPNLKDSAWPLVNFEMCNLLEEYSKKKIKWITMDKKHRSKVGKILQHSSSTALCKLGSRASLSFNEEKHKARVVSVEFHLFQIHRMVVPHVQRRCKMGWDLLGSSKDVKQLHAPSLKMTRVTVLACLN